MPEATATATKPSPAPKLSEKQMADQLESGRQRAARNGSGDEKKVGPDPDRKGGGKGGIKQGISSGLASGFKSAFREPGEVGGGAAPGQEAGDEDDGLSFAGKMAREGARNLADKGGRMAGGAVGGAAGKKIMDTFNAAKKILQEKSPEALIREGMNLAKNYAVWPMLFGSLATPVGPLALATILVALETYWVMATIYKHKLTVPMAIWEHILILLFFLAQIGIVIAIMYGMAAVVALVTCDGVLAYFPQICAAKNLYGLTQ